MTAVFMTYGYQSMKFPRILPSKSPDIDMGPFGDIGDVGTKETSNIYIYIHIFCENQALDYPKNILWILWMTQNFGNQSVMLFLSVCPLFFRSTSLFSVISNLLSSRIFFLHEKSIALKAPSVWGPAMWKSLCLDRR